ncbi:type VII secretion protein EccCa [Corynebacterium breve]|uniref:Type VII secretion protein EccCa n=1 Tax=Corynebacterium breve TaxID=3049799 RepID=A0ABY8VGP3_9CORY|nr:type VII secretion protein EccCa [Corynebacterium breve]WIM68136.1 type VII secretion protein EccCa [Corynebacterium breve]
MPQGSLKAEPVPGAQRAIPEPIIRIIMPVVMVTAVVAMVLIMALSGRGMSPMMMIFPLMMLMSMLMMISPPERTGDIDEQRRVYLRHLDALSKKARSHADQQRDFEQFHHPHPGDLTNGVAPERLWERLSDDPRACEVRIGLGSASLCTPIEVDDPGSTEDLDPVCAVSLRRAVAALSSVHDIPIAVQLRAFRIITLSGKGAWPTLRSIVAQLLFFHGPETVGLVDKCSTGRMGWLKWVEHTRGPASAEFTFIIVDADSPQLSQVLISAEAEPVTCVLVVAESQDDPVHRFADEDGIHFHADNQIGVFTLTGLEVLGTPDEYSHAQAEQLARAVSAFRRPDVHHSSQTGNNLLDLLGLPEIDHLAPQQLWPGRFGTPQHLTVPIGVDEKKYPVLLDIKESAHGGMGPHGLCIGATGSGKSELLRTLVVALAATHSPHELNFVLVDFKGGATFLGLEELPHTSAVITNLADEAVLVERMYEAISGELNRRQELLRRAGNFANITEYTEARLTLHPELAPLPVLALVVDEFSELLGQHPDFAELFVAVGRLGRSLGVHLLLASQRLEEGKLRGLDSHLSYRIGLKTFSAAESRQVLGVADAYQLPSQPGAGFLRGNTGQLQRFQAAYVSGPLVRREANAPVPVAQRVQVFHGWDQEEVAPEVRTTLDDSTTLVAEIVRLATAQAEALGEVAHQVWLPPLPANIELSAVCKDAGHLACIIGIEDVPYHQRQDPLVLDLSQSGGHFAIAGGPQTGKSTALRTIVASLAATHTTDDLAFYIINAGNGVFRDLEMLPHVAGVADRTEPEKLRRIIDEVAGFLDEPVQRHIVLVLDGWQALVGNDVEFDDIRNALSRIASEGPAVGIHLVISTQRWTSIRASVRDLIGHRLELRLGEAMDSLIDRKAQKKLPTIPGRGLTTSGGYMLIASTSKQDVAHIASRAVMPRVPSLRMLPAQVTVAELGNHEFMIPLGIGGPKLETIGLCSHHLMVFGTSGSGKSTLLATVMESVQAFDREDARLVIIDPRRAHLGTIDDNMIAMYAPTTESAAQALASAATTLGSRLPGPEITAEQIAKRSWWSGPEIHIVIDDFDLLPEEHIRPLIDLLPHAADIGMHVYLARKFGGTARALLGRFLSALKDQQPAVLVLDGNRDEGALFGYRPTAQPPGRATLIEAGEIIGTVQIATTQTEETA